MLYICIAIIIFILFLYIWSLRKSDAIPSDIDRKRHRLYFLYPMARNFLILTGFEKILLNKAEISRKIRALYISDHHNLQIKLYWYQKTALFLFVIFSFSCISMILSLQACDMKNLNFNERIIRPKEGEGDSQLTLEFRLENEFDKDDIYEDKININNKERIYTDKEWREVLEKSIPFLEKKMLGENKSAEHIDKDLNLIKKVPGTGIAVEWIPDDYRLITASGRLVSDKISETGTSTLITAVLIYEEKRVEHTIPITIWPIKPDNNSKLLRELHNLIDRTENKAAMDDEWKLPNRIGDYIISWKIPESNLAFSILIIGFFGSVLLWIFMDRALDDKMKVRRNQMILDYPEIINKFNLLVNAGMTIKQAWIKITEDYCKKTKKQGGQMRYAYEEMLVTLHELRLGIPEPYAYEQFGIRAGILPFMKFSTILVQNLKKGNRNMTDLLKQEANESFLERKETAKRLGEEASTKLLAPMMILLLIVLVIILTPAFINFQM